MMRMCLGNRRKPTWSGQRTHIGGWWESITPPYIPLIFFACLWNWHYYSPVPDGEVTHRFIYKCQIRVWTSFCDKKKVTEVFWVKMWHLEVWQRKEVRRILGKRWEVGRGMELVDTDISQWFFFQNTDVIHAKESAWSPPCHWLLETAGTAPKLCCLLRDFNQARLCYLGFLSQQQKLPSGSVLFNQFYWTISSVCSGRKPGQFCKVYRHSKISIAAFDPNLLSQFLCLLCGV